MSDLARELALTRSLFVGFYRQFPFADWDEKRQTSNSLAVQMALMLAAWAPAMIPAQANRLHFAITANAPRSGKTLLAEIAFTIAHGRCVTRSWPRGRNVDEELKKEVNAALLARANYLLFDNAKGRIDSPILEQLMTSKEIGFRVLGTPREVEVSNQITVCLTANDMELSTDLANRFLIIQLFVAEAHAQDRKVENVVDAAYLRQPEVRRQMLAGLNTLVEAWRAADCPRPTGIIRNGFEEWCRVYGGIVEHAGFGDPLALPRIENLDADTQEGFALIKAILDDMSERDDAARQKAERDNLSTPEPQPKAEYEPEDLILLSHENKINFWMFDKARQETDQGGRTVGFRLSASGNSRAGKFFSKWLPDKPRHFRLPDGRECWAWHTGEGKSRRYVVKRG